MTEARWWHLRTDGTPVCDLCPRRCVLPEGQVGSCGVRGTRDGRLLALTHGGIRAMAVDPVEKKPLYHWLPGTRILSLGGVGCNLACDFCQNWTLSQAFRLGELRPLDHGGVVTLAREAGCPSVAFTYNEPLVAAEWVIEAAQACQEAGLRTVAVTAGYVQEGAREAFFDVMDAVNIDLKSFREAFYRRRCGVRLAPVLETLTWAAAHGPLWLEVTTLVIPGENDSEAELRELAAWLASHCGPHTPLHLSAFHPDHRLLSHPATPETTLIEARAWAKEEGLQQVYLGNVRVPGAQDTCCPGCGLRLVRREGSRIRLEGLEHGRCRSCGAAVQGRWT